MESLILLLLVLCIVQQVRYNSTLHYTEALGVTYLVIHNTQRPSKLPLFWYWYDTGEMLEWVSFIEYIRATMWYTYMDYVYQNIKYKLFNN